MKCKIYSSFANNQDCKWQTSPARKQRAQNLLEQAALASICKSKQDLIPMLPAWATADKAPVVLTPVLRLEKPQQLQPVLQSQGAGNAQGTDALLEGT